MLLASLFDLSYITVVYVTHARSRKCINSEQTNNFRHRLSSTLKTHKVRFNQLLLKANTRNGIDFFFYMDFLTECSVMILHQMMAIICFRKKNLLITKSLCAAVDCSALFSEPINNYWRHIFFYVKIIKIWFQWIFFTRVMLYFLKP